MNALPNLFTFQVRPWPTFWAISWPDRLVLALGAVGWVHFIDAASFHAQPNAGPVEHTIQFVLAVAAGPLLAWLYLRGGRGLRAAGALIAGMPMLWAGSAIHCR